jgi:DNA-binding XRE family transcriptional regulator
MKGKNRNLITLDECKDRLFGKRGTKERDKYESGFESFRIGFLIQAARLEQGMTQEQLAEKVGMSKAYISRIENDLKDTRISTLHRIIEQGLGGRMELSIRF